MKELTVAADVIGAHNMREATSTNILVTCKFLLHNTGGIYSPLIPTGFLFSGDRLFLSKYLYPP